MSNNSRCRAIVKQILSGDCIVVRGRAQGGPPPERTIALANIIAPKIARKEGSVDEPFAWEAREFLRTRSIGKEVEFVIENTSPQGREYGNVYLLTNGTVSLESLSEGLVAEGLAEVRKINNPATAAGNEVFQKLVALEATAKDQGRGKWSDSEESSDTVRNVNWKVDNMQHFLQMMKGEPLDGIIDHVRDGSSFRITLLPKSSLRLEEYTMIYMVLSGVRTPSFRNEGDSNNMVPEEYAEEAKYFVESRILQRQISVYLETISGQSFVGSVVHPNGNIAQLLLQSGLAFCVDWSMAVVSAPGASVEVLRAAEKGAKEKRLRYWKNHSGEGSGGGGVVFGSSDANDQIHESTDSEKVVGKVIEVVNGDAIVVKCVHDGVLRKFYFSSLRPPRLQNNVPQSKVRPLYDIPYMFEAREFLRKKLVGKKVTILSDYVQAPFSDGGTNNTVKDERHYATVIFGSDVNVAETLIAKGLANVVKYRPGDDKRSRAYDQLLAAEAVAQKKAVHLHSKQAAPTHRVVDIAGDSTKSKHFLPFLQKGGGGGGGGSARLEAIVEFVVTASRFRIFIPKETCLITFLCAGVDCVKPPRTFANGMEEKGDPFGVEAFQNAKELLLQREVDVEIDGVDKVGNFIGWLFLKSSVSAASHLSLNNYNVRLVEHGFATIHFTANKSLYFPALTSAEEKARASKTGIWSSDSFVKSLQVIDDENMERLQSLNMKSIDVSASKVPGIVLHSALVQVGSDYSINFSVLPTSQVPLFNKISEDLKVFLTSNPPIHGAFTPSKSGEICAACYTQDNSWYRAKIHKIYRGNAGAIRRVDVVFIDYGNTDSFEYSEISRRITTLPTELLQVPSPIKSFRLAGIVLHQDEDERQAAEEFFQESCLNLEINFVSLNEESKSSSSSSSFSTSVSDALLFSVTPESNKKEIDVSFALIREGFVLFDKTVKYLPSELKSLYMEGQELARNERRLIWQYGDFTGDDL